AQHVRAVLQHQLGAHLAFAAGDALHEHARVLVDEDGHRPPLQRRAMYSSRRGIGMVMRMAPSAWKAHSCSQAKHSVHLPPLASSDSDRICGLQAATQGWSRHWRHISSSKATVPPVTVAKE